jgi:helicase
MAFKGLFIGIDRFSSPEIDWLSCARRDAVAMHALFTDTFGGETTLLVDEQATRNAIEKAFEHLVYSDDDDFIVFYFSGHGTKTHELVAYDTDPWNYARSGITLDLLSKWFSLVPSKKLLCILDCCFSGGMGVKALQVEGQSRDISPEESFLSQLSGEGRLIFTACGAKEKSREHLKTGHGWMTYYLLEALQGAEDVRQNGKISVYQLLSYVTRRVIDATGRTGRKQHPTMRGSIDGELILPIFKAGDTYYAAFPDRSPKEVTSNLQSLETYDLPPELISSWASFIPSLNQLQLDAINHFHVLKGEHLLVSAPTSSGKTLIGELAAISGALHRKRAFFLLPLKALVNDKYEHFRKVYASFGLKVIRATGDHSDEIPALVRGQYDICLMTYEKFSALALGIPHILEQVGTVVVDEIQMIADEARGVNLEFVLTLLLMRRKRGAEPQLIALSAVLGDTNGLERWLGARLLRRDQRPVPLNEGVLKADGSFRYLNASGEETIAHSYVQPHYWEGTTRAWIIPLVQKLVAEGKQVIVFRETRGEARHGALYLARALGLPPVQSALDSLPTGDVTKSSSALRDALIGGVAFHTSDLDPQERRIVEESFRERNTSLRVLVATTTLAMGINTPADAVVIAGLEHPGKKLYSIAEYKNIAGRAGRLGYAKEGSSFVIAPTQEDEYYFWDRYVRGKSEDLHSRFLADTTDIRSLILRILVAAQQSVRKGMKRDEITDFLEESFGVFQKRLTIEQWIWDRQHIAVLLAQLKHHQLIEEASDGVFTLTKLGWIAGQSGLEVESVIRVVAALSPLAQAEITDPTLLCVTQLTVELDAILFPFNTKSTQKEPQVWRSELQRQNIPHQVLSLLEHDITDSLQPTRRAKKTVASLFWITDRPLAEIEAIMTRFGGGADGIAGPIQSLRSRICDILPTIAGIAETLHVGLDLSERVRKLLIRLEFGIPAVAVDLATQVGNVLTRGDYQKLIHAGLANMEAIENSTDTILLEYLDHSLEKVSFIREAVIKHKERITSPISYPLLPSYEG